MDRKRITDQQTGYLKKYGIFYLTGLLFVLGMKLWYSRADAGGLDWILAPTAWWVRTLSGLPFEREPQIGYVNHGYRFVIARSCSGVQFMIIAAAVLIFSYVHRMKNRLTACAWTAGSMACSYGYTILINGIRITLSIYVPVCYSRMTGYRGWVTPERLHTVLGTAVYFTGLLALYLLAGRFTGRLTEAAGLSDGLTGQPGGNTGLSGGNTGLSDGLTGQPGGNTGRSDGLTGQPGGNTGRSDGLTGHPGGMSGQPGGEDSGGDSVREMIRRWLPPVFWYFLIVLGIPFLNGAYRNNRGGFAEYACVMMCVCFGITGTVLLMQKVLKRRKRRSHFR